MAFNQRKFAIRLQRRDASKVKPARVSLVSQRRIVVNGKVVTAGAVADLRRPDQLKAMVQKPKPVPDIKGAKVARAVPNLKVGKKWARTEQSKRSK